MVKLFSQFVEFVDALGYLGIFIMTFIESTFVPIPSEITMIPAGYLVSTGEMNFFLVLIASVSGTVGGALFNYCIAYKFGRILLLKYGKYFFINEEKLIAIEFFFARHGAISAFSGRLLPGVKHFISFPAGLAKMNVKTFFIYSLLGGFIWNLLLIMFGYYIGNNLDVIHQYMKHINVVIVLILAIIVTVYFFVKKK